MKKLLSLLSITILFSCNSEKKSEETLANQNAKFDAYKERFIEALWKQYPGWASGQGYHKYDSVLVIPNEATRASDLAFSKAYLDSLKSFDLNALSDNNKT